MNKQAVLSDIKNFLRGIEAVFEVILLSLTYFLVWRFVMYPLGYFPTYFGGGKYVLMGVYGILIAVVFHLTDSFRFGYLKFIDVLVSSWLSLFIVDFITYFQLCLIANVMISVVPMLIVFFASIVLCFLCTLTFTSIYHHTYTPHDMLLIYGSESSLDIKFKMDGRSEKYKISEIISYTEGFGAICQRIEHHDAVIINDIPVDIRNVILKYCFANGIRAYASPKISDVILSGAESITLFDTPLLLVKGHGLTLVQRFVKRTMDIVLCSIAMIPGAPIMLLVALAIKLEDHGPVFFKQKRVTRNGKVFEILKFRSMIVDAEKNDQVIPATGKDPRITKVGSIIRAIRIDELPQLLNILKGDMSIVGPRPERVEHVEKYAAEIPEWHFREKVKGGLTGYAQIIGKYNTSPYDKLRMDLMYIANYSLFQDLKIIFMTVRILFSKESTEGFEMQQQREEMRQELLHGGSNNE